MIEQPESRYLITIRVTEDVSISTLQGLPYRVAGDWRGKDNRPDGLREFRVDRHESQPDFADDDSGAWLHADRVEAEIGSESVKYVKVSVIHSPGYPDVSARRSVLRPFHPYMLTAKLSTEDHGISSLHYTKDEALVRLHERDARSEGAGVAEWAVTVADSKAPGSYRVVLSSLDEVMYPCPTVDACREMLVLSPAHTGMEKYMGSALRYGAAVRLGLEDSEITWYLYSVDDQPPVYVLRFSGRGYSEFSEFASLLDGWIRSEYSPLPEGSWTDIENCTS